MGGEGEGAGGAGGGCTRMADNYFCLPVYVFILGSFLPTTYF